MIAAPGDCSGTHLYIQFVSNNSGASSPSGRRHGVEHMLRGKMLLGVLLLLSPISLNASGTSVMPSQAVEMAPEARAGHSMAFDRVNNVSLMFGGFSYVGGLHSIGDTWAYSAAKNEWNLLETFSHPSPRAGHSMAYCASTHKIVLYGGSGHQVDTWSYSCNTQEWSHLYPHRNPGPRYYHDLAYDPVKNAVVLFGGFDEDGLVSNETWVLDCSTKQWEQLSPAVAPLARYGHVMVYDSSLGQIVLTGGNAASAGHQDDTWVFNASTSTWTEKEATGGPDPLKWSSITYDSLNQRCILFGGQIEDHLVHETWTYRGEDNEWSRRFPLIAPPSRIISAMSYDSESNVTVLFGGLGSSYNNLGDTWIYEFQSNTWANVTASANTCSSSDTSEEPFPILLILGLSTTTIALVAVAFATSKK